MNLLPFDSESFFDDEFSSISIQEEEYIPDEDIPEELGILPLKNTVLYPGVIIPITVGREKSIQLIKESYRLPDRRIGVVAQRNVDQEDPSWADLYSLGTVAKILKLIKMPDGSMTIVIQGRNKFSITDFLSDEPYFRARVRKAQDLAPGADESRAMMMSLREEAGRIVELSPNIPNEAKIALDNIDSLNFLIYFIASNLNISIEEKQQVLAVEELLPKGEMVLQFLDNELKVLELSEEIQSKVKVDLDRQQREYILRQQIRTIQDELGETSLDTELDELRNRARQKPWPEPVARVFEKEMNRLSRLTPAMPDYGMVLNYVEWLLDLPWAQYSPGRFDFSRVQQILDEDHYGLEKVKERILEFLAVLKLKADNKAPILCFYGPPGVGKTSLGKSIARSLGKEFVRISLGGVRDEAEIRGHRRTYIGAMPGRIVQGLKKASTSNPVLMLDEIDKVGNDFRGDPSSALLEVLDPEQNHSFRDNFLEVEYDLSRILFICTANTLTTIHPALRDRMEIIEINGYSQEEKGEIARRHLIPKARREHGLKAAQLVLSDKALELVIQNYTRESGVRSLSQQIGALCRRAAREIVMNGKRQIRVSEKNLRELLGIPRFENEAYQHFDTPGVSIGLAWTAVGGEILFIESILMPGSGKLNMTGQLGEVMRESATLAYTYLRSHADRWGIPREVFQNWDIHLHIPAGAIPKDGPSAGTSMLTALASLLTQRVAMPSTAMTGEITLRGKVLPVGGIQEKVLAAVRAGIQTILLPQDNAKDVSEIKPEYLRSVRVVYVSDMEQLLRLSLEKSPSPRAINLAPQKREGEFDSEKLQLEQIRQIVAKA